MYGVCSGTDFNTCVLHNAHLPANAVSRKDGVLLHYIYVLYSNIILTAYGRAAAGGVVKQV